MRRPMETFTLYFIGAAAAAFLACAAYLRYLRKRAEAAMPAPLVNPHGKRRPAGRRRK